MLKIKIKSVSKSIGRMGGRTKHLTDIRNRNQDKDIHGNHKNRDIHGKRTDTDVHGNHR